MLDLKKVKMPSAVLVDGVFFDIKTDFRCWLNFSQMVNAENIFLEEYDSFYVDKVPQNRQEGLNQLLLFFQPRNPLPRTIGRGSGEVVLDYEIDSDLIFSAFMEQYGIDLLATDKKGKAIELHWHKFLALLNGLHDTKLNEIMSYRCYNPNEKSDYEKSMMRLKMSWRLPQPENKEIQKARNYFNSLFKK